MYWLAIPESPNQLPLMSERYVPTLILGAGISGLTAGYHLKKSGRPFLILDQNTESGGVLKSIEEEGFTLDLGANSFAITPEVSELIEGLGLEEKAQKANANGSIRYLMKDEKLHAVRPGLAFMKDTPLLSFSGKARLMTEPFRGKGKDPNESVTEFFIRRVGKEAYDYLVEPILGGIYGGDPSQLNMAAAMPKIWEWEQNHGSILKGMMNQSKESSGSTGKREILSFQGGMKTLTQALNEKLEAHLAMEREVVSIEAKTHGFRLYASHNGNEEIYTTDQLIWALPATQYRLLEEVDSELSELLGKTIYAPMGMLFLGYERQKENRYPAGFGFLVPAKESNELLGAIWNADIFDGKAPENQQLFTLFVGGARTPVDNSADFMELAQKAQEQFEQVMGIGSAPIFKKSHFWSNAIPQYGFNYLKMRKIARLRATSIGLFLGGSSIDGISVGDCIKSGKRMANLIIESPIQNLS